MAIDNNDNIYLTGDSDSDASGDKTENSYGLQDVWVVKLSPSGTLLWEKAYGGDLIDQGKTIEILNGYLYASSYSESSGTGNKLSSSQGMVDFWLMKTNITDGTIIWEKSVGGNNFDLPTHSFSFNDEFIIHGGQSMSSISGDKTQNSYGLHDYWFVITDTAGTVLEDLTIGGSSFDAGTSSLYHSSGAIFSIGLSSSDISGVKTSNSWGGSGDFWIVELNNDLSIANNEEAYVRLYPNPAISQLHIECPAATGNELQFDMMDLNGKVHRTGTFQDRTMIRTTDLSKGVYVVRIMSNETVIATHKVILN